MRCTVCDSEFGTPSLSDLDATQAMPVSPSGPGAATARALDPHVPTGWTNSVAPDATSYETIVPGSVLGGRYDILRLLGEGGMGAVFEARDREVDRIVALKVIRPELAGNASILRMFKQELILARQVTHPNVIRIYDLGLVNDLRFITMQFVEGRDLHTLLAGKGKFPAEEAAAIMVQVCEGLEAAHRQNVVHRDLKPHNIMVDAQGHALVMDFGLAHSTDSGGSQGALQGTPHYMSPEQANCEELDSRSDVYAIGIIFYELLTGSLPFEGANLREILDQRIHGQAPPPVERDPAVPKGLNEIVAKCLARKREDRYQTAAEIVHDIQVWQGVLVPPSKVWKRVSLAFAGLLVFGVALGVRAYLHAPAPTPKPVTVLVGDFSNHTGERVLDGTLEPLFTEAMESASFISAYPRARARRLAGQVKAGASVLDGEVARLVALREGINVVVVGAVGKSGSGFEASVTALDAATGKTLAHARLKEPTKEKLAALLPRLARPVRKALGDGAPAAGYLEAGETFSAASLAAAQEYSLGQDAQSAGRYTEAIMHYRKALDLDPNNGRAYSGMGVRIATFFQTTTMIISIPSVIVLTCMFISLWGGSIRFNTPMLFVMAFLPMFGIGGLTGLPLGLSYADIHLHDTYYVIAHFHYIVAPGTIFALFAGIYYWFPKITGRMMNEFWGRVHFWLSLIFMNLIFQPMFAQGMAGMLRRMADGGANYSQARVRRLYDGGAQYSHAQGVLHWNAFMSISAWCLGLAQIPFIINLFWSIKNGKPAGSDNPWEATTLEWQTPTPPPHGNFARPPEVHRGPYEYSVPGQTRDFTPQNQAD
ncbi:MAG: cbb3-type cytochrome c oxidase subunit I [Acidobacteriia bacterium]|nr:cbb3-type cytochrome c oxidase subunit I [Terriglobia bacterium]